MGLRDQIIWLCRNLQEDGGCCLASWQKALGCRQYRIDAIRPDHIHEKIVFVESVFEEDWSDLFEELRGQGKYIILLECGGS